MRRSALVVFGLALAASGLSARAQDARGAPLPCWGFCQMWMGGQAAGPGPAAQPTETDRRFRRRRWGGHHGSWAFRASRSIYAEREIEDPVEFPARTSRRARPVAPKVAILRPAVPSSVRSAAPPVVAPASASLHPASSTPAPVVTPAVAAAPGAQPKIVPAAAATAPKVPAASRSGSDVPAAPLE